jgi:hypothetical protein
MRRSSFRLSIATLLVLGGCAAALAIVSGSKAGSTDASTLALSAHPAVLTANGTGFAKATFKAAGPGPGIGSATHVAITVTLPSGLAFDQAHSSTGCSIADPAIPNNVVCIVGTVNAGVTATRFVTFTGQTASNIPYTITASAVQDNGNPDAGGGGSSNMPIVPNPNDPPAQVTVVAGNNPNSAGNCLFNADNARNVHTPAPTASTNAQTNQSTGADVGTLSSALGIPCAYADVGEDAKPPAGFVTAISHDNIAQLTGVTKITITLASLPVPFSQIVWRFFPSYVSPTNLGREVPISPCVDNALGDNDVCSLPPDKTGRGGVWQFLQRATGSDPGYGA